MSLYFINGEGPQPLPSVIRDQEGNRYSNLGGLDTDTLETLGIVAVPERPDDTETQIAEWDEELLDWVMVDRPSPPEPTLEEIKASAIEAVDAATAARFAEGIDHTSTGLHIAVDVDSRANMGAMATTALAAASEAVPWPASYVTGWITMENTRIPLPTPADGLALASAVGDVYAQIRQHSRNLKDDILAAEDAAAVAAAVAAIDIEAGWPA